MTDKLENTVEIHTREINVLHERVNKMYENFYEFKTELSTIKHELFQQNKIIYKTNEIIDRIEKWLIEKDAETKIYKALFRFIPWIIFVAFLIALIFDMPSLHDVLHSIPIQI